ncbi:acyltransferase [Oceanobacillus senegalensis]|uniref:acyltransferase n=1 Tax=Oceanobacillus senegalensis TaxID=1936063 RepID=UPI000A305332|nr:acyltransferase [Oceanobacillus senegalensis]
MESTNTLNIMERTEKPKKKKYFFEVSFVRAIASLCIVMIHVTAMFINEMDAEPTLVYYFNQITRYGTAMFALISGFLLFNQVNNRGFQLSYFVKSRFTKIMIPFLVWSIFYVLFRHYFQTYTLPSFQTAKEIKDFIYFFLTGESYYHLYFIAIVVQFYILFAFLQLLRKINHLLIATLIAFFINLYFIQFDVSTGIGIFDKFFNDHVFILKWIFYFMIGGLLAYYWSSLSNWINKNRVTCFILGVIIVVVSTIQLELNGWLSSNYRLNFFYIPIAFVAGSGLYFLLNKQPRIQNMVVKIGNLSMGIYLVHPIVIVLLNKFIPQLFLQSYLLPISYGLTVIISILAVQLITKVPFGNYIVTVAKVKK